MPVEPFKYLIQPVVIRRDEKGKIVGEAPGEVLTVYSAAKAMEAITEFEAQVVKLADEEEKKNG